MKRKTTDGAPSIVVGYWAIRGFGQSIRMLLEHLQVPYEDKRYDAGKFGSDDYRKEWTDVKETLGFDFPNLPYLIDNRRRLTQSNAIIMHLGRRFDLLGEDLSEMTMIMDTIYDLRNAATDLAYGENICEKRRVDFLRGLMSDKLPIGLLVRFNRWMSTGRMWLCGERLSVCDFVLCETLEFLQAIGMEVGEEKIDVMGPFTDLRRLNSAFFALPHVTAFRSSSRCIHRPFCNPEASLKL